MPKYLIERDLPGASRLSPEELQAISRKSCAVLRELGPAVQWKHSYVAGDKFYCIYIAPSEELVREHARMGGFPVTRVARIGVTIDPSSAE